MSASAAGAARARRVSSGRPSSARTATGTARPAARIRWDRLGRLAMMCVMVALLYLYLSAGLSLLSTWRESKHDAAQVLALERQNRLLARQHAALASPGALQAGARRLGMVRPGEQAYVVSGLPSN